MNSQHSYQDYRQLYSDPLTKTWPYLQIVRFENRFLSLAFFKTLKSTLFLQLSLGNSIRNANRMSEKTVSLATLFPVCVLIILPYESSSQNPNIGQTFRIPKIQIKKSQKFQLWPNTINIQHFPNFQQSSFILIVSYRSYLSDPKVKY